MKKTFYLRDEIKSKNRGEIEVLIEIIGDEEKVKMVKNMFMTTLHKINRGHEKMVGYRIRNLYRQHQYPHNRQNHQTD